MHHAMRGSRAIPSTRLTVLPTAVSGSPHRVMRAESWRAVVTTRAWVRTPDSDLTGARTPPNPRNANHVVPAHPLPF
jgi:hypothetical protein